MDENDFRPRYGFFFFFFESFILKVTWSQLYSQLLLDNYEAHWSSILKDTLHLKILRAWIKLRVNSSIKTWVNIMKRKSTKVPLKLSFAKTAPSFFKEHWTKIDDISLIVIHFFFSKTNLDFKSYPVSIDILHSFCHSLFTFFTFYSFIFHRFWSSCSSSTFFP